MHAASYWLSASVLTMTSAPELEARLDARHKGGREPAVVRQRNDVVDAACARQFHGPVARAIVDQQPLDLGESGHLTRQSRERRADGLLLVECGDLDDQVRHVRKPLALCPFSGGLCFTLAVEGSDRSSEAWWPDGLTPAAPERLIAIACAAACVAILAAKFLLAARINVNWDEFYLPEPRVRARAR